MSSSESAQVMTQSQSNHSGNLVSVIIPTFNRERCIRESVSSVLAQTHPGIEVLVVDDGSTDQTASAVASLNDSRVHFFTQSHQGACAARNYGMKQARGSYIAFHDSDDVWFPNKVEKQLALLRLTDTDVCFCRMRSHTTFGRRHGWYVPRRGFSSSDVSIESLLAQNYVSTQSILGKRDAMLSEEFDPAFPRLQDWDYVLRLMQRWTFSFEEEVLVEQRVGTDSISASAERRAIAVEMLLQKHQSLYDQYPQSKAVLLRSLGKTCLHFDASQAKRAFQDSWAIEHNPQCLIGIGASVLKAMAPQTWPSHRTGSSQ